MPLVRVRATVACCVQGRWYAVGEEFDVDDELIRVFANLIERADRPRTRSFADRVLEYYEERAIEAGEPDEEELAQGIDVTAEPSGRARRKSSASSRRLEKGSSEAKARMAKLRDLRRQKQSTISKPEEKSDDVRHEED